MSPDAFQTVLYELSGNVLRITRTGRSGATR